MQLHGEEHELRRLVHAERAHQVCPVHGHGVHAQIEEHRDLLVRFPVGDELQDLLLALRQAVVGIVGTVEGSGLDGTNEDARELGTQILLAGCYRTHGAREVLKLLLQRFDLRLEPLELFTTDLPNCRPRQQEDGDNGENSANPTFQHAASFQTSDGAPLYHGPDRQNRWAAAPFRAYWRATESLRPAHCSITGQEADSRSKPA